MLYISFRFRYNLYRVAHQPSSKQNMLATDQILNQGRYRIINSVGQDDAGGTYVAYDTVSSTSVVLRESIGKLGKVATASQVIAMNEAFAGGAKALTQIRHEALISVQDYFSEIDRQYLVLESVTGLDLNGFLIDGEQRPSLPQVLSWAEQLLNGLNYLHRLSPPVFHRDIRPENIKLTAEGRVKLLITGVETDSGATAHAPVSNRTVANTTFHYRPLEQLWAGLDSTSQRVILNDYDERSEAILLKPHDARSDLYSFAASIYHILTGTLPFDALDRSIAILEGKADPLLSPTELDKSIPSDISKVLMTAMAIRRENRFDSAVIMFQVLRTAAARVNERKPEDAKAVTVPAPEPVFTESEIKSADPQLVLEQNSAAEDRQIHERESGLDRVKSEQIGIEAISTTELVSAGHHPEEINYRDVHNETSTTDSENPDEVLLELEVPQFTSEPKEFESLSANFVEPTPIEFNASEVFSDEAAYNPPAFNWRIPAIAVAAVLLLAVFAGAWKLLSSTAAAPSAVMQQTAASSTDEAESRPVSDQPELQVAPIQTATTSSIADEPAHIDGSVNHRQQIAQQEKLKKPLVSPAKPAPAKKTVTVDDLIKDN